MMKKGFFLSMIFVLILFLGISAGSAETMLIPGEVSGARSVVQYRQREQTRIVLDTPTAYPGYAFLGREYGEWGGWADWSTTAAVSSAMMDVETRESEPGVTEYRTRTRICRYQYGRWGDWSSWTDEVLQELKF